MVDEKSRKFFEAVKSRLEATHDVHEAVRESFLEHFGFHVGIIYTIPIVEEVLEYLRKRPESASTDQ